jgi:hypothetical protein
MANHLARAVERAFPGIGASSRRGRGDKIDRREVSADLKARGELESENDILCAEPDAARALMRLIEITSHTSPPR